MERKGNYTKEFKIQACELVVKNGLKVKTVADKMGISLIMLYRWIDQYKTYGTDAFVGKGHLRPEEAKLKKLQKENEAKAYGEFRRFTQKRSLKKCTLTENLAL